MAFMYPKDLALAMEEANVVASFSVWQNPPQDVGPAGVIVCTLKDKFTDEALHQGVALSKPDALQKAWDTFDRKKAPKSGPAMKTELERKVAELEAELARVKSQPALAASKK